MCGLAGAFFPRSSMPRDIDLDAMLAVIRHRGPNGEGRYVSSDRRFQLGFRRLAIIDLATGDQPIVEDDGRRVLAGNGEVYNYLELRTDEPDYPYQTSGDIEVVLPLADRYGDAFVDRLNGMYALALFERHRHRLLLVRDRLGVKPIYWSETGNGGLVFGSEIKALFASGLIRPCIDEQAVSAYFAHGYVPGPRTLFAGINKLLPGHLLAADDNGIAVRRYWRALPVADLPCESAAIESHLANLLGDAVRLQLRSDVPVGALLSGGIDSGLMVALAAAHAGGPLNTYTVRFEGAPVDESPLAAAVAERYATRHTLIDVPATTVADFLPVLAWHCEEPLNDASLLPNYLIEKVLAERVTVALNGTGGDELFAGYGRYFQLPVERRYLALPRWLRHRVVEPVARAIDPMLAWKLKRAEKRESDRGLYLHDHSTHFPAPLRDLIGCRLPPVYAAQQAYAEEFQGPADTAQLYADLNTYLPDDLLTLLDRTSMAVGVEGRVPFLDHRLVEAALAVPPDVRIIGGQQKSLERRIAARFLPEAVLAAPKQGFASPVPAWIRSGLGESARKLLTDRRTLDRGWWTAAGIDRLLADPDRHGFRVYTLLMLELAVRTFVDGGVGAKTPASSLEELADG